MLVRVVHLDGGHRGRTDAPVAEVVRIGTDPDAEVRVGEEPGILPVHARVVFRGPEALLEPEGPVRLNGRSVEEVVLRDGDLLELGETTKLRWKLQEEDRDHVRSYHADLARASAARPVEPPRRASRSVAAAASLFFALLAGGAWLLAARERPVDPVDATLAQESRRRQAALQEQRRLYEGRIEIVRSEMEDLEQRMAGRDEVEQRVGEVQRAVADVRTSVLERVDTEVARSLGSNPDLQAARDAVERIRREDDAAERVIAENGGSVCLVQGAYGFGRMVNGEWKFLREASEEVLRGLEVSGDRVPLMLEGDGPLFRIEYTGTGFLADASGIVLTNRHIAQPWWNNDAADPLLEDGFEPRFFYLRAYFPGRQKPVSFELGRTLVSEEADLAALRFEPKGALPRPLRLADPSDVAVGRRVILLGFPSGLNALIARSDEEFAERFAGDDFDAARLLDELARRDLVRPLPTQGFIGDIVGNKMLFDAPTAGGGSGAPLFDLQGRVVAVNYGILKAFSGANFGVPVRYAGALIEAARRK